MLDVHVVDSDAKRRFPDPPLFSFSEHVHSFIFHEAGIDVCSKFAHLRRMHDYYADATYAKDELLRVVEDIERLLPMLAGNRAACDALRTFQTICADAHSHGKTVWLVCD